MGAGLAGPLTDKDSGDGLAEELGLSWGYSGMQGWRDGMEDAHITVASLGAWQNANLSCFSPGAASTPGRGGWHSTALFGVLDGHGGENVALYCQRHLPAEIASGPSEDVAASLVDAFHRMDEMLTDPENLSEIRSLVHGISPQATMKSWYAHPNSTGSTAVVCAVRQDVIYTGNAGDSRAVISRRGQAVNLSDDHKPNNPIELARIMKAGGCVEQQRVGPWTHYRVNGNLNLSRSIGDLGYKKNPQLEHKEQMICSTPDVRTYARTAGDEFIVLACDGVWDVMTSQEVVDYVRDCLGDLMTLDQRVQSGELRLSAICESLLDRCVSPDLQQTMGLGGDNMTAVLVLFGGGQPETMSQAGPQPGEWMGSPSKDLGGPSWLCPHC